MPKGRSKPQMAARYASNVWGIESATWSGAETRRLLAAAYLAGMRAAAKNPAKRLGSPT